MGEVQRKLHNRNGVTILFGLLALMVAAMVSVVIVAAAVSGVKRVADDRTEEQEILTLNSAAAALRDTLMNSSYTETVTQVQKRASTTENWSDSGTSTKEVSDTTSVVKQVLTDMQYISDTMPAYSPSPYTMEISGLGEESTDFTTIKIQPTYTYDGTAYREVFKLYYNGKEQGSSVYMGITCNRSTTPSYDYSGTAQDKAKTRTVKTSTEYTWDRGVIGSEQFVTGAAE